MSSFLVISKNIIFNVNILQSRLKRLLIKCAIMLYRYDAHSGGEREIQRTMLELLNQLDGFDSRGDVKVILATNKIESLDPALLRPGRIDRKIEFPLPDIKTRRRIFQVHASKDRLYIEITIILRITSLVFVIFA